MRTTLKPNEKVLIIIRQHWLRLVIPILAWLVISTILLVFFPSTTSFIAVLVLALYPAYEYLNWKHNLWCVTNLRVVDESGFLSRYSKESPLDKINNVEYDQTFWGRIFGFGNVDIQTAAEMGETVYDMIHHPKLLKDTITHAQEEYKKMQLHNQATQLAQAIATANPNMSHSKEMVADELQKLFNLYQQGAITQEEYQIQKNKLLNS
ncbi:MAG: PH domain-containing protein [Ferruginibacter sp.]